MRLHSAVLCTSLLAVVPVTAMAADIPGNKQSTVTLPISDAIKAGLFETRGDSDWYKVKLEAGKTYAVFIDGNGPGDFSELVIYANIRSASGAKLAGDRGIPSLLQGGFTFSPTATGTYFVEYKHDGDSVAPIGYAARITTDCRQDNKTACLLELGKLRKGSLNYAEDWDWFKVVLSTAKNYTLKLESDVFVYGDLRNAAGNVVWSGSSDFTKRFRPSANGTYYFTVAGGDDYGGKYTVRLTSP
jgi:hypothetical protein